MPTKQVPIHHKDLAVVTRLHGTYDVTVDGSVNNTQKYIGTLPKGAVIVAGASQAFVEVAFNGTTPAIAVGDAPQSTGTITANTLFATADVGTAAAYKPMVAATVLAGHPVTLVEPYDVYITFTGGGTNTAGKVTVDIAFTHSNDITTY